MIDVRDFYWWHWIGCCAGTQTQSEQSLTSILRSPVFALGAAWPWTPIGVG